MKVPANLVPDRPPSKTASCDVEEDEDGADAVKMPNSWCNLIELLS